MNRPSVFFRQSRQVRKALQGDSHPPKRAGEDGGR